MTKKSLLYVLLDSVFLAVFNTVFFVVGGTEHPASVWIAYSFIHLAYLMVLATPILTRKSSSAAVFGFSIYTVSTTYFIIEFIVGLVFIFLKSESYKMSLIVQIIIAGIYAVLLLSTLIANENTADSIERREAEVAYIKNVSSRVALLKDRMSDKKANREIERAYDALHASPSRTNESVQRLETEISDRVYDLEQAVRADSAEHVISISKAIVQLTEERNRILR